jgi:hypothetical protein
MFRRRPDTMTTGAEKLRTPGRGPPVVEHQHAGRSSSPRERPSPSSAVSGGAAPRRWRSAELDQVPRLLRPALRLLLQRADRRADLRAYGVAPITDVPLQRRNGAIVAEHPQRRGAAARTGALGSSSALSSGTWPRDRASCRARSAASRATEVVARGELPGERARRAVAAPRDVRITKDASRHQRTKRMAEWREEPHQQSLATIGTKARKTGDDHERKHPVGIVAPSARRVFCSRETFHRDRTPTSRARGPPSCAPGCPLIGDEHRERASSRSRASSSSASLDRKPAPLAHHSVAIEHGPW